MTEYAPEAIKTLYGLVAGELAGLTNLGIVGDPRHTYGYHRARSVLPPYDYSVMLPDDQAGDPDAASALDLGGDPSTLALIMSRLINATGTRDPRLRPLREFLGSLDGVNVTGRDVTTGAVINGDSSHLWHVHLSILRRYATDTEALSGVAAVLTGQDVASPATPDSSTPQPIREDDADMILVLVKETKGRSGYWVAGDIAWPSVDNAARKEFQNKGGMILNWPQAEVDRLTATLGIHPGE